MKSRTGKQIRDRYINNLDPSLNRDKFSEEEDKLFLFRKIHLIFLLDITWSLYSFLMVVGFILSSIILVVAVMS